jgi:hypothetical protein
MTSAEALELTKLLADTSNDVSIDDACATLAEAMTARENIEAVRKKVTADLRVKLELLEAPLKAEALFYGELIDVAKLRLAATYEAHNEAVAAAIAARQPVPPAPPVPKGLTVKTEVLIEIADPEALGTDYLKAVPDMDVIGAAIAQGNAVEGVTTREEISVILNRKNYGASS